MFFELVGRHAAFLLLDHLAEPELGGLDLFGDGAKVVVAKGGELALVGLEFGSELLSCVLAVLGASVVGAEVLFDFFDFAGVLTLDLCGFCD